MHSVQSLLVYTLLLFSILCVIEECLGRQSSSFEVDVFVSTKFAKLDHFWESTGLCPPLPHNDASYLLSDDMKQNLILISSVPHRGIRQVRVHWLLDLITKNSKLYDFLKLDELVNFFFDNELNFGFELMGSPSGYFDNFDDLTQVFEFKDLVKAIASRYVKLFGLGYVSQWNFETWNEPDHRDFDNVTMTATGFLKYYDACSEGLLEVNSDLKFGGPGGACYNKSKLCWALLDHVVNGRNYLTGQKGTRMDYISIHKKGSGVSRNILATELETIGHIFSRYPELKSKAIYNDEADPLVGWSKSEWWRADVTYAAMVVKVIAQHQYSIIANETQKDIDYKLLSNDNAFLNFAPNFFTQRTLNARFQINNTSPKYVHFIRKPVIAVMGLLAKLGDVQVLSVSSSHNDVVGQIASRCSKCPSLELSVLVYNSADSKNSTDRTEVLLNFHGFKSTDLTRNLKSVTCNLNNRVSNPYALWKELGSPVFPNAGQLIKLHAVEEPQCSEPAKVNIPIIKYQVRFDLPLPGVALHFLCEKPAVVLGRPTNLQVYRITVNQVLISWKDAQIGTKCIQTYVVEFAHISTPATFLRVNPYKVTFNSFIYIVTDSVKNGTMGWYRVKAVDFWDRHSSYSKQNSFK